MLYRAVRVLKEVAARSKSPYINTVKILPLMNRPGLGLFEISGVKKTKLLRILDEMGYLAYHQFQKLGRLQTVLVRSVH